MRLKKLELCGFKSFADRTTVYFDKGVTCVVGPNGCGKSNISDSIRWVLGERRPKLLRGSKMEDVIFSGTQLRKPVAYAEVSLTIDNRDNGLPIDYKEVTLTRRLHRSGESEYLINKTTCRLKDIQDLILDTGIGSNSYSMIEQGRIDYILNASSDERRFLIEEAAGISKYKVKKEEAIRKLERTDQNLLRLRDIVAEVQRNIQYAERQARRAKKYQEQFEKLKDMETRKAFYDLSRIGNTKELVEQARVKWNAAIEALNQQIAENRQVQEDLSRQLDEIMQRYSEEEGRRYQIKGKLERNEQQLRFNQEKKVEIATRRGEIQHETSQLHEQIAGTKNELELKRKEMASMEDVKRDAREAFDVARKTLEQVEGQLESAREVLQRHKEKTMTESQEAARLRNEYHRLCAFLETTSEQQKKQAAGVSRYQTEMQQWKARKEDCEKSLHFFENKCRELAALREGKEEERKRLDSECREAQQDSERHERLLHEKETRVKMLEEMDAAEGYTQENLLEDLEDEEKSLLRHLRDVIHVEEGFEWAAEALLGDFAKALISEKMDLASKLLRRLKEKNSTPTAFLVREFDPAEGEETPKLGYSEFGDLAVEGPLSAHIRVREGYEHIVKPFFQNVFVLESLTEENFSRVLAASRDVKLVTREGTILGPGGRIYFRHGQLTAEQSLFKRGAEIEQHKREIAEIREACAQSKNQAESLNRSAGVLAAEIEQVESDILDAKTQRASFESMNSGMQDRLGTYQQELELIYNEHEEMQERLTRAIKDKTRLEISLVRAEDRLRIGRLVRDKFTLESEYLESAKSDALKSYADRKAKFDNLLQKTSYLEEAVNLLSHQEKRDQERLDAIREEANKLQTRDAGLTEENEKIDADQAVLREAAAESDRNLEGIRTEKNEVQARLQELEETLLASQESRRQAEESIHEEEKKLMDIGYQSAQIHERLTQSYKIDLRQLNAEDYPMDVENMGAFDSEMDSLRKKIESIGTVNLLAIEEYDELKERFDFLQNQEKDLLDAKASLMEAIKKINRTTKGLFETTFNEVQNAFGSYYTTLFRGGEAKLVLIDESNPLESGVDIVVRPPGKKLQHISLLSGGEKAMTAMALLFALFKIKPSPFCVLDEVDAPLDEANVDRFLHVLQPFLETTQFIIVTHNRKTIAMGDSLYGVTMQEAGVSKIVSVKVAQDAKDEAFEEVDEIAEDDAEEEARNEAEDTSVEESLSS